MAPRLARHPPYAGRVLLHDLLARRATTDGSAPFLTCYLAGDGANPGRTELSARSFANWVAKTANLITDDADLEPGDRVELRLAAEHPGHWMTLIWTMAAWQAGMTVVDSGGDLVVAGPTPGGPAPAVPAYVCSLHPLGLGLKTPPAGWADFSTHALAQPDAWFGTGPESAAAPTWELAGDRFSQADLLAMAPATGRILLADPESAWAATHAALVAPLLGGGSSVVTLGVDEAALARIVADERVDR